MFWSIRDVSEEIEEDKRKFLPKHEAAGLTNRTNSSVVFFKFWRIV